MNTDTEQYKEYLEDKYLPGREIYLNNFLYPKYLKYFIEPKKNGVVDLGCGNGAFLNFCKKKNISATGIDSNTFLVETCKKRGLNVLCASVTDTPDSISYFNVLCDNVIEHLDENENDAFFKNLKLRMSKGGCALIVVPGKKGYAKDPTHKTMISPEFMNKMLDRYSIKLRKQFYYPFNTNMVSDFLYLNMTVFILGF